MKPYDVGLRLIKYILVLSIMTLLYSGSARADAATTTWAKILYGDTSFSFEQTADNGFITVSAFYPNSPSSTTLVNKLDGSGNIQWRKRLSDGASATYIRRTSDGGYVAIWGPMVLKFDSNINIEWQQTYGSGYFAARSIQQTHDGGYIIGGDTNILGSGSYDILILKLDAAGNIEWQKVLGGSKIDIARLVQQTLDGGYLFAADTYSYGAGGGDFWIVRLDPNGNIQWQKTFGSAASDKFSSNQGRVIQQTTDGGFVFSGTTNSAGNNEAMVAKIDSQGNLEWQKRFGPLSSAASIQQTLDGGYVLGGNARSPEGAHAALILKLNPEGNIEWQKTYGPPLSITYSLQQTPDGGYIMSGYTSFWLIKVDNNGNISGCASSMVHESALIPYDLNLTVTDTTVSPQSTNLAIVQTGGVISDLKPTSLKPFCTETDPNIAVDPSFLDFGSMDVFGSATKTLTVSNTVSANLSINSVTISGANASEFSQTNNCTTLPGIGSCSITVAFAPSSIGAKAATLTVTSNDPDTPTVEVALSGVGVDNVPPTSAMMINGQKGNNDWYITETAIMLTATDYGSGVKEIHYMVDGAETAVSGSAASFTISADGEHAVSYFAVDNANNRETAHPLSVKIDKTPPLINLMLERQPNEYGWYNRDADVHMSCDDSVSGIAVCERFVHMLSEGAGQKRGGWAMDKAGNKAEATVEVNIDLTQPEIAAVVAPAPNENGWHNTDVTVTFTCRDVLSGIASCPAPITVTTESAGQVITGTAVDKAGNEASTSVTLNIDKTAPAVTISVNPAVLWPPNHKMTIVTPVIFISDNLDSAPKLELVSVVSSEPDNGLGDGDTAGDISITSGGVISLRAERSGAGSGRIYTVTYRVTDSGGNSTISTADVIVPHDMR